MALLALGIIKSRQNEDGTFAVKMRITNGKSTTNIPTLYAIEDVQRNGGQVI